MGHFCMLVVVLLLLVAALVLMLVSILTDWWYRVDTQGNYSSTITQNYNFHYGFWRLCYNTVPDDLTADQRARLDGSCLTIYQQLIEKNEGDLDYDLRLRLHLSRTVVGCAIAAVGVAVGAALSLLCAVWPGRCDPVPRPPFYLTMSLFVLLASMCGIASGISFIALRDLDATTFRSRLVTPPTWPAFSKGSYEWSSCFTGSPLA
ncbi:uncharacterized protein LOC112573108 [Pomacea canaliculata]|uniref:uncharacterized protein LOC112573108 n=1 Tax=Pomacea canaliculata TaxID=400727 RepID=UPI000D7297D6|nr:uncharacterized protein LOC112573108 [Pomacea canaliculata]